MVCCSLNYHFSDKYYFKLFYKQKVFIEKVKTENPGLPCFCYGHSTGAAITLKVHIRFLKLTCKQKSSKTIWALNIHFYIYIVGTSWSKGWSLHSWCYIHITCSWSWGFSSNFGGKHKSVILSNFLFKVMFAWSVNYG